MYFHTTFYAWLINLFFHLHLRHELLSIQLLSTMERLNGLQQNNRHRVDSWKVIKVTILPSTLRETN